MRSKQRNLRQQRNAQRQRVEGSAIRWLVSPIICSLFKYAYNCDNICIHNYNYVYDHNVLHRNVIQYDDSNRLKLISHVNIRNKENRLFRINESAFD